VVILGVSFGLSGPRYIALDPSHSSHPILIGVIFGCVYGVKILPIIEQQFVNSPSQCDFRLMHLIFLVMNWCSRCTSADSWSAGAGSPTCLFVLISPFLLTTIHEEQNKPITINMPSPGIRLATIDIE